jgi:hypothetical protein
LKVSSSYGKFATKWARSGLRYKIVCFRLEFWCKICIKWLRGLSFPMRWVLCAHFCLRRVGPQKSNNWAATDHQTGHFLPLQPNRRNSPIHRPTLFSHHTKNGGQPIHPNVPTALFFASTTNQNNCQLQSNSQFFSIAPNQCK